MRCSIETVNRTSAYDAVTDGFECISNLRELCQDVIRGEKENMDRPFYRQVEDFIGTNPIDCQEVSMRISIYTVLLSGNYMEAMAERFRKELKSDLLEELNLVNFQKLRDRLCGEFGGTEGMNRIDQLFCRSFMAVSPLVCWPQGITDALLGGLLSRGRERGRLIFQMLLDGKARTLHEKQINCGEPSGGQAGQVPRSFCSIYHRTL